MNDDLSDSPPSSTLSATQRTTTANNPVALVRQRRAQAAALTPPPFGEANDDDRLTPPTPPPPPLASLIVQANAANSIHSASAFSWANVARIEIVALGAQAFPDFVFDEWFSSGRIFTLLSDACPNLRELQVSCGLTEVVGLIERYDDDDDNNEDKNSDDRDDDDDDDDVVGLLQSFSRSAFVAFSIPEETASKSRRQDGRRNARKHHHHHHHHDREEKQLLPWPRLRCLDLRFNALRSLLASSAASPLVQSFPVLHELRLSKQHEMCLSPNEVLRWIPGSIIGQLDVDPPPPNQQFNTFDSFCEAAARECLCLISVNSTLLGGQPPWSGGAVECEKRLLLAENQMRAAGEVEAEERSNKINAVSNKSKIQQTSSSSLSLPDSSTCFVRLVRNAFQQWRCHFRDQDSQRAVQHKSQFTSLVPLQLRQASLANGYFDVRAASQSRFARVGRLCAQLALPVLRKQSNVSGEAAVNDGDGAAAGEDEDEAEWLPVTNSGVFRQLNMSAGSGRARGALDLDAVPSRITNRMFVFVDDDNNDPRRTQAADDDHGNLPFLQQLPAFCFDHVSSPARRRKVDDAMIRSAASPSRGLSSSPAVRTPPPLLPAASTATTRTTTTVLHRTMSAHGSVRRALQHASLSPTPSVTMGGRGGSSVVPDDLDDDHHADLLDEAELNQQENHEATESVLTDVSQHHQEQQQIQSTNRSRLRPVSSALSASRDRAPSTIASLRSNYRAGLFVRSDEPATGDPISFAPPAALGVGGHFRIEQIDFDRGLVVAMREDNNSSIPKRVQAKLCDLHRGAMSWVASKSFPPPLELPTSANFARMSSENYIQQRGTGFVPWHRFIAQRRRMLGVDPAARIQHAVEDVESYIAESAVLSRLDVSHFYRDVAPVSPRSNLLLIKQQQQRHDDSVGESDDKSASSQTVARHRVAEYRRKIGGSGNYSNSSHSKIINSHASNVRDNAARFHVPPNMGLQEPCSVSMRGIRRAASAASGTGRRAFLPQGVRSFFTSLDCDAVS